MNKTALLVATTALTLLLASGIAVAAPIDGTDDDDSLFGTKSDDRIHGWSGNDTVAARAGDDRLFGNDGSDKLFGQRHNDALFGGPGDDVLQGATGNDALNGGSGNDRYSFGTTYRWGKDTITADASGTDSLDFYYFFGFDEGVVVDLVARESRDEVILGTDTLNFPSTVEIENVFGTNISYSPDIIYGNRSNNWIRTYDGDDEIHGRGGNDHLEAFENRDTVYGNGGDDTIEGGNQGDTIYGGPGKDSIYGDTSNYPDNIGDDVINVADGDPGDTVDCGPGTDTVEVDTATPEGSDTPVPTDDVVNCEAINQVN